MAFRIYSDPRAGRRIDVVVDINHEQRTWLGMARLGFAGNYEAAFAATVLVPMELRYPDEVEHREHRLLHKIRATCPAPPHLLIEDRRFGEAGHDQVDDFGIVEPSVDHVH